MHRTICFIFRLKMDFIRVISNNIIEKGINMDFIQIFGMKLDIVMNTNATTNIVEVFKNCFIAYPSITIIIMHNNISFSVLISLPTNRINRSKVCVAAKMIAG